jgi:hypothetical protein
MYKKGVFLVALLFAGVFFVSTAAMMLSITATQSQPSVLAIVPPETVFESFVKGQRFTVNVSVSNVADLKTYELKLSFNKTVLSVVGVKFLFEEKLPSGDVSVTPGVIHLSVTYEGGSITTMESAALACVSFEIKNYGLSPLHLSNTSLLNSMGQSIPHDTQDGVVLVRFHDVAVVKLEASTYETYVGRVVFVNVTVKNLGTDTERVNVKVYYNNTLFFNSSQFNLSAGESLTVICEWNTSSVLPGHNYQIKAEVSVVPYEADVSNNALVDGFVKVKIVGDINNDNFVDINDLVAWDAAWGSRAGDPHWNPQADINGDGVVDNADGILIVQNYRSGV